MSARRAFTLIELLLAMTISSFVIVAALGLFTYLDRVDEGLSGRFEDLRELGQAREVVRRAMISLVAIQPQDPQNRANQRNIAQDEDEGEQGDQQADDGPPLLVLAPTLPDRNGPLAPKKLELTLRSPPIAGGDLTTGVIRGAFELVPYRLNPYWRRRGEHTWALLWTPLDPEGETVVLADRLRSAQWALLGKDNQWRPELSEGRIEQFPTVEARTVDEFPRGLRLVLETWSGRRVDWLFEPGVEIRPAADGDDQETPAGASRQGVRSSQRNGSREGGGS